MGELLRDSFRQVSREPAGIGLLFAVYLLGDLLLGLLFDPSQQRFSFLLVYNSLMCFGVASFIDWTAQGLQANAERSLPSALRKGLARFLPLLLMSVCFGLVVGTGLLFLILPGLYLALCMSLASAPLVLDGRGPIASLNSSYRLVKRHLVTVLGLLAVVIPVFLLVSFAGGVLSGLLQSLTGPIPALVVQHALAATAVALLYSPIVLAWLRLSTRAEGPDAVLHPAAR